MFELMVMTVLISWRYLVFGCSISTDQHRHSVHAGSPSNRAAQQNDPPNQACCKLSSRYCVLFSLVRLRWLFDPLQELPTIAVISKQVADPGLDKINVPQRAYPLYKIEYNDEE